MQLTYLDTTKLYQSCYRVQSLFAVCSAHEIELKKNSRLISETLWQALVLLSKDVVEKLWSFVKAYGYENRSRYLVKYIILYSVTLTTPLFWYCFSDTALDISKFQKSGQFGVPPPKDRQCLLLPK